MNKNEELDLTFVDLVHEKNKMNQKIEKKSSAAKNGSVSKKTTSTTKKDKMIKKATKTVAKTVTGRKRQSTKKSEKKVYKPRTLKPEETEKIIKGAYEHSCKPYDELVAGEYYVSREDAKQEKIERAIKVIGVIATSAIILGLSVHLGKMEVAGEIKGEINKHHVEQDIVGGRYNDVYVHDDNFRDYMNACGDQLLVQEFKEAKKEVQEEMYISHPSVEEVVDYMENQYLEEYEESQIGRGK